MSLRITGQYTPRNRGESLYITADGELGVITGFSGLDQIAMTATMLKKCRRQAKAIAAAKNCFDDKTVDRMRSEARLSVERAVVHFYRGIINLKAGFVA